MRKRAKDLEPGDVVEIPTHDAKRLGVPYAEVLGTPRAHADFATPFLGIAGVVLVDVRAVGGNGARMSCTWCGSARLAVRPSADPSGM
jgi:hypothetical protein